VGRLSGVTAVTIDAYGTLVELVDPVPELLELLRTRGVERTAEEVGRAARAEMAYYRAHVLEGRDDASLASLQRDCAAVFLEAAGADLSADELAPHYRAALRFRPLAGIEEPLDALRARGLRLAVVSNWDVELPEILAELGLAAYFDAVVTSAEAGAAKPDPRVFELALERLATAAQHALHVGDSPADEEGARSAGLHFVAAPLERAVEALA
jgi:putative hydrolase of the HAD superfamily